MTQIDQKQDTPKEEEEKTVQNIIPVWKKIKPIKMYNLSFKSSILINRPTVDLTESRVESNRVKRIKGGTWRVDLDG